MSQDPALTGKPVIGDSTSAVDKVMLSVIVSSYNACNVLCDCLQSIYWHPPSVSYEVIVIDDASTDATTEAVRTRFPAARLFRNKVNLHYTRSNNLALAQARGEYVCLLNNDTIVLPRAFDEMLAFLRAHPNVGAVGCKLLNEDRTMQWSIKPLPDLGAAIFGARSIITRLFPGNRFSRRRMLHLDRDSAQSFTVGYISGAAKMMPRNVVDKVGPLDERMFYHVDADYCKRIVDAGYGCYYLPTVSIVHLNHKGGTMASLRSRFYSLLSYHVDCYIYYRKHMQRREWSPMRIVILSGLAVHFVSLLLAQIAVELIQTMPMPLSKRPSG